MTTDEEPLHMIDNRGTVETPEGVALHLRLAGPASRGLALAIDTFIWLFASMLVSWVMGFFSIVIGEAAGGIAAILIFAFTWFYSVYFEMYYQGRTIGKMVIGLQTLCSDGTPLTWNASMLRNLLRVADFLPIFYLAGIFSILFNERFQRLGDIAAGTVVVYRDELRTQREIQHPKDSLAPPFPLSQEEQLALVQFAERMPQLGQARSQELSDILKSLTGQTGEHGSEALQKYAAWLVGGGK